MIQFSSETWDVTNGLNTITLRVFVFDAFESMIDRMFCFENVVKLPNLHDPETC